MIGSPPLSFHPFSPICFLYWIFQGAIYFIRTFGVIVSCIEIVKLGFSIVVISAISDRITVYEIGGCGVHNSGLTNAIIAENEGFVKEKGNLRGRAFLYLDKKRVPPKRHPRVTQKLIV